MEFVFFKKVPFGEGPAYNDEQQKSPLREGKAKTKRRSRVSLARGVFCDFDHEPQPFPGFLPTQTPPPIGRSAAKVVACLSRNQRLALFRNFDHEPQPFQAIALANTPLIL